MQGQIRVASDGNLGIIIPFRQKTAAQQPSRRDKKLSHGKDIFGRIVA